MTRLVMKFGGSLLASPHGIRRVGDLVERVSKEGAEIVVVVSALGDVTDTLLQAATDARGWSEREILLTIDELKRLHLSAIEDSSVEKDGKTDLILGVEASLGKLKGTLSGISILGELSPRSKDLVVSFGERLSAPIVSAEIR
ncbi:MAG TPA: hypothetical protein VEH01_04080, partial [Nitrososphaerales archaeon]|nr:hypothetical protein [Nitrososphaerales archaeon]